MKNSRASRMRHRPLFVESLESRAMLAGNVTAFVRDGTLFVIGDNADNSIVMQQTGFQRFTIAGAGTTVNGGVGTSTFFTVRRLDVDLRGGDDTLGIGNDLAYLALLQAELDGGAPAPAGNPANAALLAGFAVIRMGDGDDALGMQLRAGAWVVVEMGNHDDAVAVEGSQSTHLHVQADISEAAANVGSDFVRIRGTTITSQAIVVVALAGDDTVHVEDDSAPAIILNPSVGGTAAGVTDFDTVTGVDVRGTNLVLAYGGVHDDTLAFNDVTATHHLFLLGGNDADTMTVGNLDVNVVTLLGEGGDDTVALDDAGGVASTIDIVLHIDTGLGDDIVNVNVGIAAVLLDLLGGMNVVTAGGQDSVNLSNLHLGGHLHIDMGPGDDGNGTNLGAGLVLSNVDVDEFLHAFLGPGDDTVAATNVDTAHSEGVRYFGGEADEDNGGDTFTDGGGNGTEGTDYFLFDFETVLP